MPWRNAVTNRVRSAGDKPLRNPITGIAGCCARAASGHAAAPLKQLTKYRRVIGPCSISSPAGRYHQRITFAGARPWIILEQASEAVRLRIQQLFPLAR